MKSILLTDAENKTPVLVVFGDTGATFAKTEKDSDGTYTEIYNSEENIIVSVTQTVAEIQTLLERK
jgi:hypothetical protein